ncbi:MAG TPA: N-acetylmuramic acid 6-phosphate etherase [Gemmatimonadales bacterium]|nr:N-acetylmuramic acid 6-phosphate etherase [Gemmatimonadales bacterium]
MTEANHDPRLTERRNPRTPGIDSASPLEIVDLIAAEDATVPGIVAAARRELARAIESIETSFRSGGRLIYLGAGTSGRLGVLDAAECPPTFGTDPAMVLGVIAGGPPALVRSAEGAEDDTAAGRVAMDERQVSARDTVVGIAASGTTPYVGAGLARAKERGATTILVTSSDAPDAVTRTCDLVIPIPVGPEVITGSTRMKAGTATKLVLNTLSTGAMIRLGKVYGNLMVDLQAWSGKLIDRGERIVMETTGVDRAAARQAIEAAGGSVKTAIVMVRLEVARDEAESVLASHGGQLRPLLGDPPPVRPPASQ